jgi:hypothetical protein|tara:strand:- start:1078 stop:1287 length:210 start_codon:yes stop_codon:yes gene_type:complete
LTNKRKTVYLNDNSVLEDFYRAIKENRLDTLHIPHSDVFFVRSALRERTGHTYPLQQIESAMRAEGWNK